MYRSKHYGRLFNFGKLLILNIADRVLSVKGFMIPYGLVYLLSLGLAWRDHSPAENSGSHDSFE